MNKGEDIEMSSPIRRFGDMMSRSTGIQVKVNPAKNTFRSELMEGPIQRVAGAMTSNGSCRLTFQIVVIGMQSYCQVAPILKILLEEKDGRFKTTSSSGEVTLYYQLDYSKTPEGYVDSMNLAKALDKALKISEKIQVCLPVQNGHSDLKSSYKGLEPMYPVIPHSEVLMDQINAEISLDIGEEIDALLGHRVLFIEANDPYAYALILSSLAYSLKSWNHSIGSLQVPLYSKRELLSILPKTPFSLSTQLRHYCHHNSSEEISSLTDDLLETGTPVIICTTPAQRALVPDSELILRKTPLHYALGPKTWLQFFAEQDPKPIAAGNHARMMEVIGEATRSYNNVELRPAIIRSCRYRYLNAMRNNKDPLESVKVYLFKMLNN